MSGLIKFTLRVIRSISPLLSLILVFLAGFVLGVSFEAFSYCKEKASNASAEYKVLGSDCYMRFNGESWLSADKFLAIKERKIHD